MKPLIPLLIILFVISTSVTGITNNFEKSSIVLFNGNTLYVGGSGPGNYTKIQDAIDNASDGNTVFVYNGVYYENILVDKKISLIGENNYSTIIDGGQNSNTSVVHMVTWPFYVCNLTIRNNDWHGIEVGLWYKECPMKDSAIFNCIIYNTHSGIIFWNSSNMLISNCTIYDNYEGVMLIESKYCRVEHCILSNRQRCVSLNIGSHNNTVINCKISGNATAGPMSYGIDSFGDYNTISHCVITEEGDGIGLCKSNFTHIDNCSIFNNTGSGITISEGNNNVIENCDICFNGNDTYGIRYGIHVFEGAYNLITRCNISDNCQGGVKFRSGSPQNTLTKSTIKHNGYKTNGDGVLCYSPNNFYLNSFIDNYIQAYDTYSNSEWDNGKYGNYWSDYNGQDWNRDGVGDKPYEIVNDSKDNFPLLCPYNLDGPSVLIERPTHLKGNFLYLRNLRTLKFPETVLFGNIIVKARVVNYDNSERIIKVKFFVDGILRHIDIVPPYTWCWRMSSPVNHRHIISAVAFDSKGRVGQDSFEAYKYF